MPPIVPRRKLLLGAAALTTAPLAAPFVARAVEPIRIGVLLAKTGQIAAQTEYLANGTFLAMEQRNNTIMGQPAELVWLDEPSPQAATQNMQKLVQENKVVRHPWRLAVVQRAGRGSHRGEAQNAVRLRQCRGDRDHRQELQPLYLPAEHAGARCSRACWHPTR